MLSDEIHCDITEPGKDYSPFASVSETCKNNSITCVAATKAFNIAGIQTAAVIVPDKTIRHRVSRGLNTDEVAEPNVFALTAPIAAFTKGGGMAGRTACIFMGKQKDSGSIYKGRNSADFSCSGGSNVSVMDRLYTHCQKRRQPLRIYPQPQRAVSV